MPKLDLRTPTDLNAALTDLGLRETFTDRADFSGIIAKPDLHISGVAHEAMLQVDEDGTKAAAATAVAFEPVGAPLLQFHADQPFLFFLRDGQTGAILFAGRVLDPSHP